jgi:hypothetical protein
VQPKTVDIGEIDARDRGSGYVFCSPFWEKWVDLYEMMLRYCSEKDARMPNGEMRAVA